MRTLTTVLALLLASLVPAMARGQIVQWTQREVSGPSPRDSHAMAFDSVRGITVLFGGYTLGNQASGETWEWSGTAWNQRMLSGPLNRVRHAMAYDSIRGVTILFGGYTSNNDNNGETWEWNGTFWTPRPVSGPSPRFWHAMAYDSARGVTVLFGGTAGGNSSSANGETWEWNGTGWTQRITSGPAARYSATMVYDAARGKTVLFGGVVDGVENAETWEWDGTVWSQRMVTGPSPRFNHAMAYDSVREVTVLFGGELPDGNSRLGETWEWNGTAWIQQVLSGPLPRTRTAMAYDSARSATLLFGGAPAGTRSGDTWELSSCQGPPLITAQPVAQSVNASQTAILSISVAGSSHSYQWRKNSVNLSDGGRVGGAASATLTITNVQASDQDDYDCVVNNLCGSITSDAVTLSVMVPCMVTQQPAAVIVNKGQNAMFSVAVSGQGTPAYRWRRGGINLSDGATGNGSFVAGATAATLNIVNARTADSGGYDCVVTSTCGTGTSNTAALSVNGTNCKADFNESGAATVQDIFDFLAAWFVGC